MKNRAEKKRLKRTLKIADIDAEKLSEGTGRCPENPQGTSPLTRYRALPEPVLAGRQIREEVFYETLALMYGIALCDFNYDVTFGSSCIGEFRTVSVDR